eukprot:gene14526-17738_t
MRVIRDIESDLRRFRSRMVVVTGAILVLFGLLSIRLFYLQVVRYDELNAQAESNRTAIIALGRPIAANDRLALVGINMMTHEQKDWVWAAFWWHDRPEVGPFAADRPSTLRGPWRNYLMQVAFDAEKPRASDGGAHICFNPWLEARFPDHGQGGGTVSN